jgi:hypothetical protein
MWPLRVASGLLSSRPWKRWWKTRGQRELRELLIEHWDPVSVKSVPEAQDERRRREPDRSTAMGGRRRQDRRGRTSRAGAITAAAIAWKQAPRCYVGRRHVEPTSALVVWKSFSATELRPDARQTPATCAKTAQSRIPLQ